MDSNHPVFSHQAEAAIALSKYFDVTHVITASNGLSVDEIEKVRVSDWSRNSNFINATRFYVALALEIITFRPQVVFSHMTEVQSFLAAPFLKLLRIKHVLWYAHASFSPYLRYSLPFLDNLVTSTTGSSPYHGYKLRVIGQGISTMFLNYPSKFKSHLHQDSLRLVHIGRLDKSKRLSLLMEFSRKLNSMKYSNTLDFFGKSSFLKSNVDDDFESASLGMEGITFRGTIPRNQIPSVLTKYDFFIHGFDGSLDKSILEATALLLPVLTINREYLRIFGQWSCIEIDALNELDFLFAEFSAIRRLSDDEIMKQLNLRKQKVQDFHSLSNWASSIARILNE